MWLRCALVLALMGGACRTDVPGNRREALVEPPVAPRLVYDRKVWAAPPGGDGAPVYTLAWEHPDGRRTPAGVGPVVHATLWRGAIVYVDPRSRLWLEGQDQPLALGVVDAPAVSPDDAKLAYVVVAESSEGTRAEVHVRSAHADRLVDRSLLSFGALRFSPDGSVLLGVGSVDSGVAGLHAIDLRAGARRCLSNCDLRVGQPWGDAFLPPPGSAAELRFEGDEVLFDTVAGRARLRWRGEAR